MSFLKSGNIAFNAVNILAVRRPFPVHVPSEYQHDEGISSETIRIVGDLLAVLQKQPPASFRMMKTTCGHLGKFLNLPGDQIPLDRIVAAKGGFRHFLASRNYAENSIRGYVSQVGSLLKAARKFGWNPDLEISNSWKVIARSGARKRGCGAYEALLPHHQGPKPASPLRHWMVLRRHIRPALKRLGITKRIGWHSFRHGLGTMLRQQGVDLKTAQELLRHANSRITLELYQQSVSPKSVRRTPWR